MHYNKKGVLIMENVILLIISALVLVYLFYVLIHPDKF